MLADTCNITQWLGLVVMKTDNSQLTLGIGYVEYAAFYDQKGTGQIHEKARFVKKDGRRVYCDGLMLPRVVSETLAHDIRAALASPGQ